MVEKVKAQILELDPALSTEDYAYKVAVVLLLSAMIGPYEKGLAEQTGYSRKEIHEIGVRFRANGVWIGQSKYGWVTGDEWLHGEHGAISFWLDVLVGMGQVERVDEKYKVPNAR